jgi:hypothetical protein
VVRATVAKDDAPDFEMPEGRGIDTADIGSLRQPASRDTAPAPPPSPTPDDDERARQSPLFPVMSRPSDRTPSTHLASDRSAASEQKTDALTVRLTATQPRADDLFVSLVSAAIPAGILSDGASSWRRMNRKFAAGLGWWNTDSTMAR